MSYGAILFDLDGTLIDSAPGILFALAQSLRDCGLQPALPLDQRLIGPPLGATLERLCPAADGKVLAVLSSAFKRHYDCTGYQLSQPYAGVATLLTGLHNREVPSFIVTNKRQTPTVQIVQELGWQTLFKGVYSPDSLAPPASSKGELLKHVLVAHGLRAGNTLYVGDRWEDALAARHAGVRFFLADWGYADGPLPEPIALQGNLADLQRLLEFTPI